MTEGTSPKPETCSACGRYTTTGQQQLAMEHRARLNLDKPLSEAVLGLRLEMAAIRGRLNDIAMAYTGWRDRLDCVGGLLTCGLIALHGVVEEMRAHEKQYADGEQGDLK